jgi:hypothetical protein
MLINGDVCAGMLCMLLAAVLSGGIRLFQALRHFVGEVVDRAIPVEALEEVSARVENKWAKWFLLKVMLVVRARVAARLMKVATSPKEILGALVSVGLSFLALATVVLTVGMVWYFGEVPLILAASSAAIGAVGGWLAVSFTVDKRLDQMLELITGASATMVRKVADKVGLEVIQAAKEETPSS